MGPRSIASIRACFGKIGNAKRTICCGPPINSMDFALHKVLPMGENKRFEFRAEFFNLFNHSQFNNPDGNTTDGSDFGRIVASQGTTPDSVGLEVLLLAGKQ